ncbi:putative phage abortive infection protein [Tenacibaculum xiamenense]|uniref:putative phage abortive infection protein n=1 Tax=Tenacibaculum xiamenense TaxID=1261553 RepID=UPI0038938498
MKGKRNFTKKMGVLAHEIFMYVKLLVLITLVLTLAYFIFSNDSISGKVTVISTVFVIPCIMVIGALLTLLAFWTQIDANEKIQKQFEFQQFESQFFEMLRLHKENITEMKITGYGRLLSYKFDDFKEMNLKSFKKAKETDLTQYVRYIENRKVFYNMNVELIACVKLITEKFLDLKNENKLSSKEKEEVLKLSYRIFFFGSKSDLIKGNEIISDDEVQKIKSHLNHIQDKHRKSFGDKNSFGKNNTTIYIKYKPFTGHENRLGHYYRHLYATVKYVIEKEKEGLFDYKKSREYLKLLRSQMSNDEQILLYYNFLFGFGYNWDSSKSTISPTDNKNTSKGEKNQFLTKYRMLHNLPIDRVYEEVPSPRDVFKNYINDLGSIQEGFPTDHKLHEDDNLFEWDD